MQGIVIWTTEMWKAGSFSSIQSQGKFAPLDYGYSGVYLQKCKVTLLIALSFCLIVGMSKMIEIDLDIWPLWPVFKILS